jgi:hypothetical protein
MQYNSLDAPGRKRRLASAETTGVLHKAAIVEQKERAVVVRSMPSKEWAASSNSELCI